MSADQTPPLVPPKYQVTERDRVLLRDVWLLRYVTALQVSRLHFGHLKVAQRRLRKLSALGLLSRFRAEPSASFGDQRWIYFLSRIGARTLGESDSDLPVLLPARTPTGLTYLAHHELLTEFRIWLREGVNRARGSFRCRFVPAYEEVRSNGHRKRRVAVRTTATSGNYIPDGVFSLERRDGRAALFVLEVDRGTEPLRRERGTSIYGKLACFGAVYDEGLEAYSHLFDRTYRGGRLLWIVPDRARLEALLHIAEALDLGGVVWVTVAETLEASGDLSLPLWSVAGRAALHSLSE